MSELITTRYEVIRVPESKDSSADERDVVSAEVVNDSYCRNCGNVVAADDKYCGKCGQGCQGLVSVEIPTHSGSTGILAVDTVLNSRLAIFGLIAFFGPIGFVALWFSPRFSKPTKLISTMLYVGVAVVLPLAIAWYWLDYSVRPLVDVLGRP